MTVPVDAPRTARPAPAFIWAALILVLTSLPGRVVPAVGIPHLDKVVHATLYAVLAALAARALWSTQRRRALLVAAVCASLFGAFDEWHQQFIPGRSDDRYDWAADTIGASIGVLITAAARARRESTS